jgi:hypothetical protein
LEQDNLKSAAILVEIPDKRRDAFEEPALISKKISVKQDVCKEIICDK